jgi:hypothetical protein
MRTEAELLDKLFNISDSASWSDPIDDDRGCEIDLKKFKSCMRFTVQEHLPRRCFVQANSFRKLKNDEKIENVVN